MQTEEQDRKKALNDILNFLLARIPVRKLFELLLEFFGQADHTRTSTGWKN